MTRNAVVELGLVPEPPAPVRELEALLDSQDFIDSYVRVQAALVLGGTSADKRGEIESLREELAERRMDQDLAQALRDWGDSPSPLRGNGSIEIGFHAGIVHYFEYRAIDRKARRFELNDIPTIQGFIDYTAMLKELLNPADPAQNRKLAMAAQVADRKGTGKRKTTVLSREGLFVVGFQQSRTLPSGIITAIPDRSTKSFTASLNEDLEGSSHTQNRFNKLGGNRILVYFAKVKAAQ